MTQVVASKLGCSFGPLVAVADVSFEVGAGSVLCLLGPNGSGKSTTIQLMVGLKRGTGRCTFGGRRFDELRFPRREVGVQLGLAPWNVGRTGAGHLRLAAAASGITKKRIEEVAGLVGLESVLNRRISTYSLGMRQRLAIGTALLGDPPVLVLDEPMNGLDAEGIRWLRGLIAESARAGRTVILSSHLLHEVERVATDVVILRDGRVRAAGSLDSLLRRGQETRIRAGDATELRMALARADVEVRRDGEWLLAGGDPERVAKVAMSAGITITGLAPAWALEDVYERAILGEKRP